MLHHKKIPSRLRKRRLVGHLGMNQKQNMYGNKRFGEAPATPTWSSCDREKMEEAAVTSRAMLYNVLIVVKDVLQNDQTQANFNKPQALSMLSSFWTDHGKRYMRHDKGRRVANSRGMVFDKLWYTENVGRMITMQHEPVQILEK